MGGVRCAGVRWVCGRGAGGGRGCCQLAGVGGAGVRAKCGHHSAGKVRASFGYCPYGSSWLYMGYY